MNLNEYLAINVMSFEVLDDSVLRRARYYKDDIEIECHTWNPSENIEQAMMCLETFAAWDLSHDDLTDSVEARVLNNVYPDVEAIEYDGYAEEDTTPMAISLACGRATGWEE